MIKWFGLVWNLYLFKHVIYYWFRSEYKASLPTYSNEQQAKDGINDISFTPTYFYPVIGKSVNTRVPNSNGTELIFTFTNTFCLKTWTYNGWVIANQLPTANLKSVTASNDKITWTTISNNSSNTNYYKYYKVLLAGSETNIYANMGINRLNFTGDLIQRHGILI